MKNSGGGLEWCEKFSPRRCHQSWGLHEEKRKRQHDLRKEHYKHRNSHVQSLGWHCHVQCWREGTASSTKGDTLCLALSQLIRPSTFWHHCLLLHMQPACKHFSPPNTPGIFQAPGCSTGSSLCLECSSIGICLFNSLIPSRLCSHFTLIRTAPTTLFKAISQASSLPSPPHL